MTQGSYSSVLESTAILCYTIPYHIIHTLPYYTMLYHIPTCWSLLEGPYTGTIGSTLDCKGQDEDSEGTGVVFAWPQNQRLQYRRIYVCVCIYIYTHTDCLLWALKAHNDTYFELFGALYIGSCQSQDFGHLGLGSCAFRAQGFTCAV